VVGRSHHRALVVASAIFVVMGCAASQPSTSPSSAVVPSASPTASVVATPVPTTTPAATPTGAPAAIEHLTETIDLTRFSASTSIDNPWFPLSPGKRWISSGAATVDGERQPRKVVLTVTDLTKEIAGVRAVVAYEVDYTDGELGEAELVFWAQDDEGVVWRMGEYPEVYEDGKIAETPTWIHGLDGALAGIAMQADPQPYTPSYAQGWGPAVEWNDRGRVFEVGSQTCVKVGCYEDVLVIDEFSRDEPDAHQLKYYVQGIGNVRTGWAGANEEEREELQLVKYETLSAAALGRVREDVLAEDARAQKASPNVYAKLPPMVPAG
jgi:hypothetical protein